MGSKTPREMTLEVQLRKPWISWLVLPIEFSATALVKFKPWNDAFRARRISNAEFGIRHWDQGRY
jgi:hypothetical protein